MAISFRSDSAAGIVIATCAGSLTPSDAQVGAAAFWANAEWRDRPVVWDFRAAQFDLGPPEIRDVARFILERQPSAPPPCVAFVTGRDVDFGLARMFEAYREEPRTNFSVFRDYDEAIAWASGCAAKRAG